MVLLRSSLYVAAMTVVTLFYSLLILIAVPLAPRFAHVTAVRGWSHNGLWLLRAICGLDYVVEGGDNIPARPVVVACKHQSAWETIALHSILPPRLAWVMKRELLRIPLFGWALYANRPIAIDRKAGRAAARQIIEQGKRRLADGRSVIIFPEGTRVPPGQSGRYGIGAALLAKESGAPVLPIAHNAGSFWARRGLRKFPGQIRVVIGRPIAIDGRTPAEVTRAIETWIEQEMARMPSTDAATTGDHERRAAGTDC